MNRILIELNMPDDEPTPEVGEEIYIGPYAEGQEARYVGGLTGHVVTIEHIAGGPSGNWGDPS